MAEYGRTTIVVDTNCVLFKGCPETMDVWMSHGDEVMELPLGFVKIAITAPRDENGQPLK